MEDLNHYNYCASNPIRYTDPTGLGWWSSFRSYFSSAWSSFMSGWSRGWSSFMSGWSNTFSSFKSSLSKAANAYVADSSVIGQSSTSQSKQAYNGKYKNVVLSVTGGKNSVYNTFDDIELKPQNGGGNDNFTGVRVTRGVYEGVKITSGPWKSKDGKTLYYGDKVFDKNGNATFTSKTEYFFKDKLDVMKNGKILTTAQVQSTPDLLAHYKFPGEKPFTIPEGMYENKGVWPVKSSYGEVAKVFPYAVLIHGKDGDSGRPNSFGCIVTYNNNDLSSINSAIKQIINKDNNFNLWVR